MQGFIMSTRGDDTEKAAREEAARRERAFAKAQAYGVGVASKNLTAVERQAAQSAVKPREKTAKDINKGKFMFLAKYMDKLGKFDSQSAYKKVGKEQSFINRAKHAFNTRDSRPDQIAVLQVLMEATIVGDVSPEVFREALTDLKKRVSNDVGKTTSRLATLIGKIEFDAQSEDISHASTEIGAVNYQAFLQERILSKLQGNQFAEEMLQDLIRNKSQDNMIKSSTRTRVDGEFISTQDQKNKLSLLQGSRVQQSLKENLMKILPAPAPTESRKYFEAAVLKIASLLSNLPDTLSVECCIGRLITLQGKNSEDTILSNAVDAVLKHLGAANLTEDELKYCRSVDNSSSTTSMSRSSSSLGRTESVAPDPIFLKLVNEVQRSTATKKQMEYLRQYESDSQGMKWLDKEFSNEYADILVSLVDEKHAATVQGYLNDPRKVEAIREAILAGYKMGLRDKLGLPASKAVLLSSAGNAATASKPAVAPKPGKVPSAITPKLGRPPSTG
jgi:hypothetical protein